MQNFKKWLIENHGNDAWGKFKDEFNNAEYYCSRSEWFSDNEFEDTYISDAFVWKNSLDGYDFWSAINAEWIGYLEELTK